MTIKWRFDRFTTNIRPTDAHIEAANNQTEFMIERLHDKVADDGSFELEKVLRAGSNAKCRRPTLMRDPGLNNRLSANSTPVLRPIVVAIAAPTMPSFGNGPHPNTSVGARTMLIALASQSTRIAMAASPALRNTEFTR